MKHFIWMLCGIFISGLLLGCLSACGADQFSTAFVTTKQTSGSEQSSPAEEEPSGAGTSEDTALDEVPVEVPAESRTVSEDEARNIAYGKVLWDAYLRGVLPDGTALDYINTEAAAMNDFALYDVDGDGTEELILLWGNASMAGMQGIVYGYRSGAVYTELSEFPSFTFYDSGIVDAAFSHNQGWGGRFWPYTMYRYDSETGVYENVGSVDAWDLSITESDETLAQAFPKNIDADGDGLVYYILTGEWYMNSRVAPDGDLSQLWGTNPVDGPDHENWRNAYIDGGEIISLPLQKLTEDNIAALGCPKPDVPVSEAAG